MLDITINKKDLDELNNKINRLVTNLSNYKKPIAGSLEVLEHEYERNFDQQGYFYDPRRAWTPLKPVTKRQRARLGFNAARPILFRTGKLKNNTRKIVGKVKGEFKNESEIAKYHQMGTEHMPARRIMGVTNRSAKAIGLVFGNYIADQLKKLFK